MTLLLDTHTLIWFLETILDYLPTLAPKSKPLLPYLSQLGKKATEKAVESAAGKFGEAGWQKAQAIWSKLSPKVEVKPMALEAVKDAIDNPDDAAYQTVLQVQLKKILDADPDLTEAIAQIFAAEVDGIPGAQIVQTVVGDRNQTIGQNYGKAIGSVQGDVTIAIASPALQSQLLHIIKPPCQKAAFYPLPSTFVYETSKETSSKSRPCNNL